MVESNSSLRCLGSLVILGLTAGSLLLGGSRSALAQNPTTVFQLNGNPTNVGLTCVSGTCDAWNDINLTGSSGTGRGHSALNTFILGSSTTNNFTGGGSKDPNDLNQWAYTSTSTPNKDTLNAGYAAAYNQPDFDIIFGADRLSPNGDANIGIWFFQEAVGTSNGGFINTADGTPAHHIDGDVFIVSAFVNGGGVSAIQAYKWDSTCTSAVKNPTAGQCAASNLRVLNTSNGDAFAITNSQTVTASWAGYSGNSLVSPLFFEGGLDLTTALGNNVPCFASFLEETRSSQSPTAVLKDFLLGSFPVCSMSVAKTCPVCQIVNGSSFSWSVSGTVTNTGIGTLYNVTVTDDSGTPSASGDDLTFSCGTLTAGQSKKWGSGAGAGDCVASSGFTVTSTTTNPITNGVTASASSSSGGGGTPVTASNSSVCATCQVNGAINATKSCQTGVAVTGSNPAVVAVDVTYSGTVTNTGNESLSNVSVSDSATGTSDTATLSTCVVTTPSTCSISNGKATLAPTGQVNYQGSYLPSNFTLPTAGGRAQFTDSVTATGTGVLSGLTKTAGPISATCTLCPAGTCPAN